VVDKTLHRKLRLNNTNPTKNRRRTKVSTSDTNRATDIRHEHQISSPILPIIYVIEWSQFIPFWVYMW